MSSVSAGCICTGNEILSPNYFKSDSFHWFSVHFCLCDFLFLNNWSFVMIHLFQSVFRFISTQRKGLVYWFCWKFVRGWRFPFMSKLWTKTTKQNIGYHQVKIKSVKRLTFVWRGILFSETWPDFYSAKFSDFKFALWENSLGFSKFSLEKLI